LVLDQEGSFVSDFNQGQPGWQQPMPGGYPQPAGSKPNNYLVHAILSTLLCCLPLGVVAIVFASQVDSKWNAGDVNGAMEASRKAKLFSMISAGIGLVGIVLYVILVVLGAAASST
jgi:hypothetical protein